MMRDDLTTILEAENCTLYVCRTFGVKLIKCRRVTLGEGRYAQYEKALYVEWVEKGKRKARCSWETYKPFVLVLAGLDNPAQADPFEAVESSSPDMTVRQTRYPTHDDRYRTDFNDLIEPHLNNGAVVLFDRREI